VAIIGILAAIAIPQYQNYVARTQVTRVVAEAGALKTPVEICILGEKTGSGTIISETCDLGAAGSSLQSGNPQSGISPVPGTGFSQVSIGSAATDSSTITATFGNSASTVISGKKVVWTRDSNGTWTCATNVDAKFRPGGCKGDAS
jgi:type IV pilus assembly protein PilA